MKKSNYRGGFITTIIIILVALVLLKVWFDFNIIDFLKSPKVSEWTTYLREVITFVWQHYLKDAFSAIWNFVTDLIGRAKA